MPPHSGGQTALYCFEDSAVSRLSPVTLARPAYAISCGSFRLIDWLRQLDLPLIGAVRPHLRELQRLDYGLESTLQRLSDRAGVLLVNARLVPSVATFERLGELVRAAVPNVLFDSEGAVAMAWVSSQSLDDSADRSSDMALSRSPAADAAGKQAEAFVQRLIREVPAAATTRGDPASVTFRWPHDLVSQHVRLLNDSLAWRIAQGPLRGGIPQREPTDPNGYKELQDGLFVAPDVVIGEHAVIDTQGGPIVIEERTRIGPFCYLAGPVHIGAGARILEHAALKDAVALGPTTKVGGEVEASVIEAYTNKQHHGFLGHSYLGSWINLGAGTCNSDLKNTYGTINLEYGVERIATDMQFMGCVMGDYSKSAINTGIFTGKMIGVCSMLYGFVTSNVPSFVNYARLFGQTATLPPEVMVSTQARMFARRQVVQRDCDRQLLWDMFDLTEEERNLQAAIGL